MTETGLRGEKPVISLEKLFFENPAYLNVYAVLAASTAILENFLKFSKSQ